VSGYTPVFRSIFEGTLCGQYPDTAAWLFLLALADKNGHVDKTPQYISAVTGMPVDLLISCIERLMQPDPASRSSAEEGRRLVLIDPTRSWGWRIVNHGHYREKARKAMHQIDATASGRDADRKRIARERKKSRRVRTRPAVSGAGRLSDSDADTDISTPPTEVCARKRATTRCPPDFVVTEAMRAWAAEKFPEVDLTTQTEAFRDHTFAKAKTDWPATWRNWIRNSKPAAGRRLTKYEESMKVLNAWEPPHDADRSETPLDPLGADLWPQVPRPVRPVAERGMERGAVANEGEPGHLRLPKAG